MAGLAGIFGVPAHRKAGVNGVLLQSGVFIEYFRREADHARDLQ